MKLIHLSDLHLGKRVNEFSMLEDQRYILEQILRLIAFQKPDAVLLAGDIYDKPVPPAQAVELFDDFLAALAELRTQVFVISGNHDSPERLAFGRRLINTAGVHLAPVYNGRVTPVTLNDAHGPVDIYMLPFVKPAHVRPFFPDQPADSYTQAVALAIQQMQLDPERRNVLVTHQFVTGATRCDSEELSVGGADHVDLDVFSPFDYVALGHLHGPQNVGPHARYCGTPLKYSFSEVRHEKSVTIVQLGPKGRLELQTEPLAPLRDMVQVRGTYEEVTARSFYAGTTWQEDYVRVVLTDEQDIPDAAARLRAVYHNLMRLDYDNRRTRSQATLPGAPAKTRTPLELFSELYELQNNCPMSDAQRDMVNRLIEAVWEEEP